MRCNRCEKERTIVNKHFKLCLECNNERLHGSKFGKQYKLLGEGEKSTTVAKNRLIRKVREGVIPKKNKTILEKLIKRIVADEEFYEKCFNHTVYHICEECESSLNTEFRNSEGKVNSRFRYSHIIPKSIAPRLRHLIQNINHLCLECHTKWDFGDKKSMKIYQKNKERFPQFLS